MADPILKRMFASMLCNKKKFFFSKFCKKNFLQMNSSSKNFNLITVMKFCFTIIALQSFKHNLKNALILQVS